jgi:hypothetical protein
MENNKKDTIFDIKANPKKQKEILKELSKVSNLSSAIHFVKNNKKYIKVNKKFKAKAVKFSIATVASLTSIVIVMSMIKTKDKDKTDIKPLIPTTIEVTEQNINPVEVIQMDNSFDEEIGSTILFPKATNTNEKSDYTNYYKVREKYGSYIDKLSEEFGIDSRLITALVSQENPNNKDMSQYGSYGPLCMTKVHDGQTYTYNHFVNGEYVKDNYTISIDNIKNNELEGIKSGVVLLSYNFNQFSKNNNYTPEENLMFAIAAFNKGNSGVLKAIRDCSSFDEACYSIRYTHAKDYKYDDDQYLEHVLNKIPDEELNMRPFTITSNTGQKYIVNFERNSEIPSVSINKTMDNKKSM